MRSDMIANTQQKRKKGVNHRGGLSQTPSYISEYQSPTSPSPNAAATENQGDADSSNKALGLKVISRQVMDAIRATGKTTYKQVANRVSKNNDFFNHNQTNADVSNFEPEKQSSKSFGARTNNLGQKTAAQQEKNLRRRVYDSLNVLYAVGMLVKDENRSVYLSNMATKEHAAIKSNISNSNCSNSESSISDVNNSPRQMNLSSAENISPEKKQEV